MSIRVITTVTAAASSYDLTTLAVVKDELGITNGASDATLLRYITSASKAAAQFCNRVFPSEGVKDEFWPERDYFPYQLAGGVGSLQLSRWPVSAVASITENGTALVDGTDYRVDAENGLAIRLDINAYPKPWPVWPIVAQYIGGFVTIPEDLADAVTRMVKARWFSKGRDPMLRQESVQGIREVQYWIATGNEAGNLSPDVEDILENYRTPTIA